ncbi:MAG: hypothetical protein AABW67_04430 [Nanoarchaeota archaeon]
MIKKSSLSLVIGILFCLLLFQSVLAVSSVSLRITGVVGDYSSRVTLRTDSNAGTGLDAYDMQAPSAPSSYSSFYSSITSASLAVDSWNPVARDVSLIYDIPTGQSGSVAFSWNQVTGTNYKAYFSITGDVTRRDMGDYSSYTYSALSDADIYVTIELEDYPTSSTTPGTGGSSGGGGGGGAVVTQPAINIILNGTGGTLLFDAGIFITDKFRSLNVGEKMESTINLIPMGKEPYLDVTLKYNIKGADGRDTGIKESDTILIEGQKNFKKEFATQSLTPGDYILELELIYETSPGKFAVATASSHFTVSSGKEQGLSNFVASSLGNYKFIVAALFLGTIILIVIILLVINKTKKIVIKRR